MRVYGDRSEHRANQGDVFADVTFAALPTGGARLLGMIISHDCDCDKFLKPKTPVPADQVSSWPITMAPVHGIDELTGGRKKAVRENKMPRYFHLPEDGGLPELVADLWFEQPVSIDQVIALDRQSSLSDEWRARLHAQIIRLRTGRDVRAIVDALEVTR